MDRYRKSKQWAIRLLVGLFIFYGLLALALLLPEHLSAEELVQWMQQYENGALKYLTVALGELGKPYFVAIKALAISGLLFFYSYRLEAYLLLSTLIVDILNLILKEIIGRERPASDVVEVLKEAGNSGFPSGHTVNFIMFFGFLLVLLPVIKELGKNWRSAITYLLLFLIFLAPISRVYAGMHWATDILGGGAFSIFFLSLLCVVYFYLKRRS